MSTFPFILRVVDFSGAAAPWLLERSTPARLLCVQRDRTMVRRARHVWGYGRLIVRVGPGRDGAPPRGGDPHRARRRLDCHRRRTGRGDHRPR